jgi:hypothetical protein
MISASFRSRDLDGGQRSSTYSILSTVQDCSVSSMLPPQSPIPDPSMSLRWSQTVCSAD